MAMSNNIPEMKKPIPGGIVDVDYGKNSLEIDVIAGFAVDEYNKKENTRLELTKVLRARKQVVKGFMYYITLEVTDWELQEQKRVYEAKVLKNIMHKPKELLEFKPLLDAPSDSSA